MAESNTGLSSARRDGVLWLTFDRPRAGNAVNADVAQALADALAEAGKDAATEAVVLTGAGEKIFSAGIDVKNPDNLPHEALAEIGRAHV